MGILFALQTLTLRDVQGLHGGRDLWIAADGSAWLRTVERGAEKRFRGTVPMEELRALLAKHDPKKIRIPERPGIPDEARPTLIRRTETEVVKVAKWEGQKDAAFDAVYGWLLKQAEEVAKGKPVGEGPWAPAWKPEGFRD